MKSYERNGILWRIQKSYWKLENLEKVSYVILVQIKINISKNFMINSKPIADLVDQADILKHTRSRT